MSQRLLRLFSSSRTLRSSKDDISKAINLLSTNFKFGSITLEEKPQYVKSMTEALNSQLKPLDDAQIKTHFNQSIMGLSSILNNNSNNYNNNKLDSMSIKNRLNSCSESQEVLRIFDQMILDDELTMNNFKMLLMNKLIDKEELNYIYNKLEFMRFDKINEFSIMLCSRLISLKQFNKANDIYLKYLDTWKCLYQDFKLSPFEMKLVYQIIWRISKDLPLLSSLPQNKQQYLLLIESIPRQVCSISNNNYKFTDNQQIWLDFIEFIISKPITSITNNYLSKLIKLSYTNHLYQEESNELTIHRYRFINGLLTISQDLQNDFNDVEPLIRNIQEMDETIVNETVLKFI